MFRPIKDSFKHAVRGIVTAIRTERSFRIQTAAALMVFVAIVILPLTRWEAALLLVAVSSVLVLELVNSTVERMADLFKPRLHPYVRDIKDLMAAAVFVASLFALAIGILVLGPHASAIVRL